MIFSNRNQGSNILWINPRFYSEIENDEKGSRAVIQAWESLIITGFQLATEAGPLCSEPMHGVGFVLEEIHIIKSNGIKSLIEFNPPQNAISIMRHSFLLSFLKYYSPRISLAMNSVTIQTPQDALGKVYAIIGRCHGRVVSEEFKQETGSFIIEARIPMMYSFGFADELRAKTSGVAYPVVSFLGFEVVYDQDPFWMPTTLEEREEYGIMGQGTTGNLSLETIIQIRKKKVNFNLQIWL